MTTKYTIPVVTRMQDNGDGGYTMHAYNNDEELLEDHCSYDGSKESRDAILNEEDPYENGYIGSDTIEIEVTDEEKKILGLQ